MKKPGDVKVDEMGTVAVLGEQERCRVKEKKSEIYCLFICSFMTLWGALLYKEEVCKL